MLKNHECTYSEVEEILALLTDEFKEQRNELEYATYDDYFSGHKTAYVGNDVVMSLNHVDGFCWLERMFRWFYHYFAHGI